LEFRELDTNQALTVLEGRAVPYGESTNVGWYFEQMADGVFDKSIAEAARTLPLLLWHDNRTWPIGKATEWRSVPGDGLYGVWALNDSPDAQRGARLARDGYLTGMSVGYTPVRSNWDLLGDDEWDPSNDRLDTVTRLEARLEETSLTPTPAFAGAQVQLVRSADRRGRTAGVRRAAPELAAWRAILDDVRARV
jgi:hypothetical protein